MGAVNEHGKSLEEALKKNKHNSLTVTYYLILQKVLRSKSQSLVQYYIKKNHVINRHLFIERVKDSYDKRVKIQQMELEMSRVKRQL